jgi:radical S-adenosyl methionine domain-containing protein 2
MSHYSDVQTLVINWHLTEACNYRCQYCYAAWVDATCKRELIRDPANVTALLAELFHFFRPENTANPLARKMAWRRVRLNIAGGEPLLHSGRLAALAEEATAIGFEFSMITNGSRLDRKLIHQLAPFMGWLGISIDSAVDETNREIGRRSPGGQLLDLEALNTELQAVRKQHRQLQLKLNTVVNSLNWQEDLSGLIRDFSPDKWKVLRMLPVVNSNLAITDQQFDAFVSRHADLRNIMYAEDNQDMCESYLMVDPHGRFFQNSPLTPSQGYRYSRPILDAGAATAFSDIAFAPERFHVRYVPHQ